MPPKKGRGRSRGRGHYILRTGMSVQNGCSVGVPSVVSALQGSPQGHPANIQQGGNFAEWFAVLLYLCLFHKHPKCNGGYSENILCTTG